MAANKHKLGVSDYVHLHNHTQYSLLDGLSKIPALIDFVKASNMSAIAITDHGTLSGAIEFYKTAIEHNIKPIIGIETYMAARTLQEKEVAKDKSNFHLTLLAMNNQGYQNLMQLSTIANLEGFYYRPRIDHATLEKYNQGLIVLSGCIGGEVADRLRNGQYDQAKKIAEWYKLIFGDRYYLEIQDHGHPDHNSFWLEQQSVNEQLLALSQDLSIPAVVTCDAHYLRHSDQEAHEVLLCVQTGSFMTDEKRLSLKAFELHVTPPEEIIQRWGSSHPEVITNTKVIANRCNIKLELGKILIPKFPVPKGETEKSYLKKLVYHGLALRYSSQKDKSKDGINITQLKHKLSPTVIKRAEYELAIIERMGFNGYFLIIADFMNWGKNQGIVFGPGRGSAAGSIIAYALKITELDPLAYDLLFERFLNPDRISMPDVDIDIQDTRRDEVIQYCRDKYGANRVANIVTFGRMAARNAVRDVARVLQVPYAEADRLAKMIPPPIQGNHLSLAISLKNDHDLKQEYRTNETAKRVFDLAVQMEGTIRSHGVHAAGVVIAPDDIVKFAPLEMAQKGVVATQYSMGPVEDLGLLKMDFLGLSNLTIIKNTLRIISRVYKQTIDINTISLNDSQTYDLFQRGDTTGVFQMESSGMKRYLKELKPTTFEDIVAMGALYRPGPMQFIDEFIARKHGLRAITYPHASMAAALKNTYGVLVYQEQVMQISKEVCGFSDGEADTLRKAIGKKKLDIMRKLRVRMIEGGQQVSGVEPAIMEKFWQQLEEFAAYCFNKSHAACYGLITYQTAYLKAHYPLAFMAALMTSDYDDTDRLAIEISECQHMSIEVLAPDVNESFLEFAVVPGDQRQIRFGMSAIKNVGPGAVESILEARKTGSFVSLEDFLARVNSRTINRKLMESLIKAGAFDRFKDRSTLLHNLDLLLAFSGRHQKQVSSGQADLFSDAQYGQSEIIELKLERPQVVYDNHQQLSWERELLGLYLSQHPLTSFELILSEQTIPLDSLQVGHDGKSVVIGGAITGIREFTTKNGQKMAFVKLADLHGELEVILFPNAYQQTTGIWERDRVVLIRGKISSKDRTGSFSNELKVMVNDAREITVAQALAYQATGKKARTPKAKVSIPTNRQAPNNVIATMPIKPPRLYIKLPAGEDQATLISLKKTLDAYRGTTEVVLVLGKSDTKQAIKLPNGIDRESEGIDKLALLIGRDNLIMQ